MSPESMVVDIDSVLVSSDELEIGSHDYKYKWLQKAACLLDLNKVETHAQSHTMDN